MANVRSSNTYYIDTAGQILAVTNIKVKIIIFTPSAANGTMTLSDVTTGNKKILLAGATANSSQWFSFKDDPLVFPNGINPVTVTNAVATLVLEESRG